VDGDGAALPAPSCCARHAQRSEAGRAPGIIGITHRRAAVFTLDAAPPPPGAEREGVNEAAGTCCPPVASLWLACRSGRGSPRGPADYCFGIETRSRALQSDWAADAPVL